MIRGLIKFAVFAVVILVLLSIAVTLLKFAFKVLLPIAILALAAYALYVIVTGKKTN